MIRRKQIDLKHVGKLKYFLIFGYALIVTAAIILVSALALRTTTNALKNKVSSLVSSLSMQMKLNLDGYLERMETVATLAFANEEIYLYDATSPDNDKYDALLTEKAISDQLYELCIMENFVDYGIVYRNRHVVGKISNGTVNQFGDRIFTDLEAVARRKRTHDGWAAGFNGNFKRIYYVKRIHDNALLVISFYTDELQSVFDNPETMKDMTIRLLNRDHDILYSSAEGEVGAPLPEHIASRIGDRTDATLLDDAYLVTVNSCGDDWYVVCSIPTELILQEQHEIRLLILLAAAAAALLAIILGMIFAVQLTRPVESFVSTLNIKAHNDQLTGILNKLSFEELAKNRLDAVDSAAVHALILLDVDNFKGVNDTLGHAYGDEVLAHIGGTLRAVFSTEDYVGRIGGDEFCVFVNTKAPPETEYRTFIRLKCQMLCSAFHDYYSGAGNDYKISVSVGCAFFPEHGRDFQTLYKEADKALYTSKKRGKDTFTLAGEEVKADA